MSSTSGSIVEPDGSKKALGFLVGEAPPAEFFNWFWRKASDIFDYVVSELDAQMLVGGGLLADLTGGLTPKASYLVPLVATSARSLAFEIIARATRLGTTVGPGVRFYVVSEGQALDIVWNAEWNGISAWTRKQTGVDAFLLRVGLNGSAGSMFFARRPSADSDSWDNTASSTGWSRTLLEVGKGTNTAWFAGGWQYDPTSTVWETGTTAAANQLRQASVASAPNAYLPLTLPNWPVKITRARLYIRPVATGRSAIPATRPRFRFLQTDRLTGAGSNPAGSGDMVDDSLSVSAYETYHAIDSLTTGGGGVFGAFFTDPANKAYSIVLSGETDPGSNDVVGLLIAGAEILWE